MNATGGAEDTVPNLFGIPLSTHRGEHELFFPYETLISAISIFFFRYTVRLNKNPEPALLRLFFCAALATLAALRKSYQLLAAVELFSYTVSWLLLQQPSLKNARRDDILYRLLSIAAGAILSMATAHALLGSGNVLLWNMVRTMTPAFVVRTLEYLFPVSEMKAAYYIMHQLALEPDEFRQMVQHLFFVTFHIQVGMGFLGIDFLRQEQSRRNRLIRLDVNSDDTNNNKVDASEEGNRNNSNGISSNNSILDRSRVFQRGAAPFIFGTALPYMIQIIFYGNLNQFAFSCVQDEMHRTVRFRQVFEHDNHLTAMALDSPTSPEAYATSMNTVISTVYEIFNRKLFSLPKVLLLPGVMSRQPMLVVQVFPFIFLSDWLKASAVAFMTTRIESLQKEIQALSAIRSKVESFDIKNAELLQRSGKGATQFTQRRWEELTVKVQSRLAVSDVLTRSKGFFAFMQRNFVFTILIDCALANLIAIGKLSPSDVFVFSRAIEDAVDMMLMRSRGEAELARMMTEIEKLEKLDKLWESSKEPNLLRCLIADVPPRPHTTGDHDPVRRQKQHNHLVIRNLHYNRGTATARADHLELSSGVYALTGSNGSGKSTLFRILMSCHTNEKSIDLPTSINLLTPSEPLTEEDDLLRERACLTEDDAELDDDADESASCRADVDLAGAEGRELAQAVKNAATPEDMIPHHKPKLSITMPSSHIVEISQNFYWPLYSRPIDWIYQDHISESYDPDQLEKRVRKVAEELHSLEFFQAQAAATSETAAIDEQKEGVSSLADSAEATIRRIMSELQELKEDWFSDLSGGQKSKVELVRTVFLKDHCPDVLLVDETMAPLDPASKEIVMAKLKLFCDESIIIVIYHTDVGQGKEVEGKVVECVPSNDFFDKNIHLEKGVVHVRETC